MCGILITKASSSPITNHTPTTTSAISFIDSLPGYYDSTVVIPFEYKQSTLNYASTFRLMDSVAEVMKADTAIRFTIDGYSHFDEGNDYVCYWLSHDRAFAVKSYIIGRGIDSTRLILMKGRGSARSHKTDTLRDHNHTAEILLHYPIPPPPENILDADGDGIADEMDSCANEYGYADMNGCPDRSAIIVPFENGRSAIIGAGYQVMDSVLAILRTNLSLRLSIQGHAYKSEGVQSLADRLAMERADIVKRYFLSRLVDSARIVSVTSLSNKRPLNAGRNPKEKARNWRAELRLIQTDGSFKSQH